VCAAISKERHRYVDNERSSVITTGIEESFTHLCMILMTLIPEIYTNVFFSFQDFRGTLET
jgi:hypothetical protein